MKSVFIMVLKNFRFMNLYTSNRLVKDYTTAVGINNVLVMINKKRTTQEMS